MTNNRSPITLPENRPKMLERLKKIKLFVLDMDGTIYLDSTPLEGAIDFCKKLAAGNKLVYFTNNASKNPEDYVKKLTDIGFPATRKNIVTSGDVTADYLNTFHKGEPVYLVGTPALEESFQKAGMLIRSGARFYSTHPDINCPTATGFIPDSGAICGAITLSTGVKPRYFGKPNAETADMLCRMSGLDRSEIAMVGDRLYTDIALGKKNGLLSILVMTGETTPEMLQNAAADETPDLIFDGIKDISVYNN